MFSLLAFAAATAAQAPARPSKSCPGQNTTLRQAADANERTYLDEGQGRQIADQVRTWAKTGRYADDCGDDTKFADRFNMDLDSYDGHFHFEPVSDKAAGEDWLMAWRAGGPASNMGIREVRMFEGSIGYLRLASFYPWDMTREKMKAAWSLLDGAQGIIIDLRQNGGGDDATAEQILRSILPETASVQRIVRRGGAEADQLPQAELPPIATDVPVAILIDRRSASASEYIAYSAQAAKRAVIVGNRSAGGASLVGDPVPIGSQYQISIPYARPENLVTKANWEKHGVRPDIAGGDDPIFIARTELARRRAVEGDK